MLFYTDGENMDETTSMLEVTIKVCHTFTIKKYRIVRITQVAKFHIIRILFPNFLLLFEFSFLILI